MLFTMILNKFIMGYVDLCHAVTMYTTVETGLIQSTWGCLGSWRHPCQFCPIATYQLAISESNHDNGGSSNITTLNGDRRKNMGSCQT